MNIKNFDYLKETLKYMGFGDKLNTDLEAKLKEQPAEFKLTMIGEFNKDNVNDKVHYSLDFSKSKDTDMYFFNKYQATVPHEDPAKERTQTFYLEKNAGITAKEAYNLLNGRAVNKNLKTKEGQEYNAWLQLNFSEKDKHNNYITKTFGEKYGYDVELTLAKYPIRELMEEDKRANIVKSLKKGNIVPVTFVRESREEKMFVSANPQYKSLDLYDSKMKLQYQGIEKKEPKESKGEEKSQQKKEGVSQSADEEGEGNREKRSRRKGMRV